MNHFEVFDLPRKLGIDTAALQQRFYALARRHHPDAHGTAPADEQARALDASARLNAAYRTLRDPLARIDYLVRLEEGRETREGDPARPPAPPDLLEEMFAVQEALQEAQAGALDDGARAELTGRRNELAARLAAEEARLTGPLSRAWDEAAPEARPRILAALKAGLATRAYLRAVIDDLTAALGEGPEPHVTHHRH